MINDHKRSEYQCQSTLIWTWLGEENYGNKRSYTSEFQVGQKKSTFSKKFVNLKKSSNAYWIENFPDTNGLFILFLTKHRESSLYLIGQITSKTNFLVLI